MSLAIKYFPRDVYVRSKRIEILPNEKLRNPLKAQMLEALMAVPLDQCFLRDVHIEAVLRGPSTA